MIQYRIRLMLVICSLVLCLCGLGCKGHDYEVRQFAESRWKVDTADYAGGQLLLLTGFTGPYGVTIDQTGTLYVPDLKMGLVIRFTNELVFDGWLGMTRERPGWLHSWQASGWHYSGDVARGSEMGMFKMPHSIDFGQNDDLFVADYQNGRIHRYSSDGSFLGLFFDNPADSQLAFGGSANAWFDDSLNLWVSDFDKHRIVKFGLDGSLIGWIGERASGGITAGFEKTGSSKESSLLGGFSKPQMVRVDSSGNIYIIETGNNRIQKLSPDGLPLGWIGSLPDGSVTDGWSTDSVSATCGWSTSIPGGFSAPVSLELAEDGMILVADNSNHRIQRFTLDGRFAGWMGGKAGGGLTSGWEMEGRSALGREPGMFVAPFDVKIHDGLLYVADGHNGRIQIFDLD
ncbi:MAG: hypothetical protein DRP45_09485 [Candidatus Zixiibacteriota bacterium]|nr:MAG: hypothetical protein DRP45_09485 [candidate division Zixibacteria bacterium]